MQTIHALSPNGSIGEEGELPRLLSIPLLCVKHNLCKGFLIMYFSYTPTGIPPSPLLVKDADWVRDNFVMGINKSLCKGMKRSGLQDFIFGLEFSLKERSRVHSLAITSLSPKTA